MPWCLLAFGFAYAYAQGHESINTHAQQEQQEIAVAATLLPVAVSPSITRAHPIPQYPMSKQYPRLDP